jgi:hypothetical protein
LAEGLVAHQTDDSRHCGKNGAEKQDNESAHDNPPSWTSF